MVLWFGIGGHEDSFIYGIVCFEIGLLLVLLATNINMSVFIPSTIRVGKLLMEVPGTPIGASFFVFELKPTGKDSADPTQHD